MKKETLPPLKNKTRGSLIRAAGKLFARKGFEGTSIREICTEAKTNVAAINYYFGDKIGLYKTVVEYGINLGNELYPLPEKFPDEDYQSFLCRQVTVLLQKIKQTSGSKWYEQIVRQEMLLPTKEIKETIAKRYTEHDYKMFYKTLKLIEPNATDQSIQKCALYLMAILGFHVVLLSHLNGVISPLDRQNITEIKSSAKSIAAFVVAGLKASVAR
jgi:TetR/AcrR family transcriptional regulator, regulator of cefoperazone and chloramphenicol sensitivity